VFTGLVEDVGTVESRTPNGPSARVVIATRLGPLTLGESVAVHGVCLTVDRFVDGRFEADCSAETLARTNLGKLRPRSRVHLERALLPTSRLGGHFVSGHVDGPATLESREPVGDALKITFRIEPSLARYVAEKGSIAIDGVSLTVNDVDGDRFQLMLIPHTLRATVLGELAAGDVVNVEVDLLARYVARLFETERQDEGAASRARDGELLSKLRGAGYVR
jgi:riboflavin synthase